MRRTLKEMRLAFKAASDDAKTYWSSVEALCESEGREPTTEENTAFDEKEVLCKEAQVQIEQREAANARGDRLKAFDKFGSTSTAVPHPLVVGSVDGPGSGRPMPVPAVATFKQSRAFSSDLVAHQFSQWILATQVGSEKARDYCNMNSIDIGAVMSSSVNSLGGALIPDIFSAELIRLVEARGIMRQWARRVPMTSDTLLIPRRTSGTTAAWIGESTDPTETDMGLDNVQLVSKKLVAMTRVPDELLADASISVADMIATDMALAIATKEDQTGFLGDGTSTHGGIHGITIKINDGNHAGSIVQGPTGDMQFSDLLLITFEQIIGAIPEFPGITPRWFISKAGWAASMMRLADAAGGVTAAEIEGRRQQIFLGYPVTWAQEMISALTDQVNGIAALFGDMSMAVTIGDRQTLTVESDRGGKYFQAGQTAFKTTERIDINVHDVGDGSNAGPIVAFKFAAS